MMDRRSFVGAFGAGLLTATAPGVSLGASGEKTSLPARKTVYLTIEGDRQKETFRLLDRPELPFTTYYPLDMIAETGSFGGGKSVRMIANFGGFRNPEARVQFFLFPAGTAESTARAAVREAVTKRGISKLEENKPPHERWAIVDYSLFRDKYNGFIILGKHGEQWFHLIVEYPWDYGDGLPPRTAQIVKELRWRDTGKGF